MADVNTLAESLVNLTIKEANELLAVLKDQYGIEPAAAAAVMAGPAGRDGAAGAAGGNKIAVIKEVRAITGLGLKEAKDLVDGAPNPVKEGASKADADDIKGKLEAAGASVELK